MESKSSAQATGAAGFAGILGEELVSVQRC